MTPRMLLPVTLLVLGSGLLAAAPSPSPSPTPSASPAPAVASAAPPDGARVTLRCPGIGDGAFDAVTVGPQAAPSPAATPPASPPPALTAGPGTIVFRSGRLDPGYALWRTQTAASGAAGKDCELDVDEGAGKLRNRYAILHASPVSIVTDANRPQNPVVELVLRHDGIALLNF